MVPKHHDRSKECFFLEKVALFVQLAREGHKGITNTIVKSSRMTTEQYSCKSENRI